MNDIFSLNNIVGVLINSFAHIYIWSVLLKAKINLKEPKYCIVHILFAISMLLNYTLMNSVIRVASLIIIIIFFSTVLFKKEIKDTIVAGFIGQIIAMVSELLIVVFFVLITKDLNKLINSNQVLLMNILPSLLAILIVNLPFIPKIQKFLVNIINNIKNRHVLLILLLILITINFLFLITYYKYNIFVVMFGATILSTIYLTICFKILRVENQYKKVNNQYNTTLNSLKEYEDILDAYRVSNHENKNQILTIRNMISKKEKGILNYIDKLIDNKIKDDEKLMFDTNKIPAGGLRAVIYSKMLYMKENKISFALNVDRGVRTVELIELGEDLMLDVCKIIGVFLDNAIQAVEPIQEKKITISLYIDDSNMFIEISNNYNGYIDLEKIDNTGYTTKQSGHGYGLSLVKEIIDHNSKLINKRKINKNIFIQTLQIKLK